MKHALERIGAGEVPALEKVTEINTRLLASMVDQASAAQTCWLGFCRNFNDFMSPAWLAMEPMAAMESERLQELPPEENLEDYAALWQVNLQMAQKGFIGALRAMNDYQLRQFHEALRAWLNTALGQHGEDFAAFTARQAKMMQLLENA